jgi:hypothetical protein
MLFIFINGGSIILVKIKTKFAKMNDFFVMVKADYSFTKPGVNKNSP